MRRSNGKRVLVPKGEFEYTLEKRPYLYSKKTAHTNKSIHYPGYCPGGRTKCSICSDPSLGGRYRRKHFQKNFKFILREWDESLEDDYFEDDCD